MSIEQEIKGIIDNALYLNKQEQKDFAMKVQDQFNEISKQMNKLGQIISGATSDTPKQPLQDDRSEMMLFVRDDGYSIETDNQIAAYRKDGSMIFSLGNKEGPQLPTLLKFVDCRRKRNGDNESVSINSNEHQGASIKTTPDSIEVVKDGVTCCRMLRA